MAIRSPARRRRSGVHRRLIDDNGRRPRHDYVWLTLGDAGLPLRQAAARYVVVWRPNFSVSDPNKWSGTSSLPYQAPTWADTLHAGEAGLHELGGQAASWVASHSDDDAWQKTAEDQRQKAQADIDAMTYGGKEAREGGFWSHPMFQTAEALPGLAAASAPAIIGGALTGGVGAIIGGAIGFGEYQRGQAVDDYSSKIMSTPTDTLKQNPKFDQLSQFMSDDDAKRTFIRSELNRNGLPWKSEALGAAVGAVGPAAEFGGAPISKILGDKLVNRVLAGGLEQSANMATLSGGQTYLSGVAEQQAGIRGDVTPGEVASSALSGAESGAQFGVAGGVSSYFHRGATPGQSGNSVRSSRDSGKQAKELATQRETTGGEAAPSQGPAQPGNVINDEQKAAMAGKPIPTPANPNTGAGKVTPGVTNPPPPPPAVQPKDVLTPNVKPEVVGAQEPQGAPPAGEAAKGPPPPPPTGQGQPAPGPGPAAEGITPEPDATIRAQHDALLDPNDPREAMVYNKGQQPIDITGNDRIGQSRLKDGRVVQYDKQGPSQLTPAKISAKNRDGKLNDILQMGPVNQEEAIQRASAGEQPAAVTTVNSEGTPVKEAVGTAATVPDQVAAHEATKGPGDTVHVENVAEPIQRREEALAQEQAAPAVTPESDPLAGTNKLAENPRTGVSLHQGEDGQYLFRNKEGRVLPIEEANARAFFPGAFKGEAAPTVAEHVPADAIRMDPALEQAKEQQRLAREAREKAAAATQEGKPPEAGARVLRSETEEAHANEAAQAEAEAAQTARVATEAPPKPPPRSSETAKPKNWTPEEKAHISSMNAIADSAMRDTPELTHQQKLDAIDPNRPGAKGARLVVREYARRLLEAAKGYEFLKQAKHRTGEGMRHSNAAVLLYEAKLLMGKAKEGKTADYERFLTNDHELRQNGEEGYKNVMKLRSESGKEWAKEAGKGVKEAATEGAEGGEAAAPGKEGVARGAVEKPDVADEYEAAKERVAEEDVAREPGVKREEPMTERQRQAIEAGKRAAARVAEQEARENKPLGPLIAGRDYGISGKVRPAEGEGRAEAPARATASFKVEKARPKIKIPGKDDAKSDVLEEGAKKDDTKTGDDKSPAEGYVRYQTGPEKGDYVDLKTSRPSTTVGDAIHNEKDSRFKLNIEKYAPWLRPLMEKLRDAVVKIAGDTPVHYVSHDELISKLGEEGRVYGKYSPHPKNDMILINSDHPKHDTVFHEAFHAATLKGIRADPVLRGLLRQVHGVMSRYILANPHALDELDGHGRSRVDAALDDPSGEELITYMMTNEHVQNALKMATISPELAEKLGVPKWRKMTAWEGALNIMRRAMGLGPRDVSAIEAMTAVSQQLLWKHARGEDDLAAATKRLLPEDQRSVSDKMTRDQDAYVKSPKETVQSIRDIDTNVMKQWGKDARTNIGSSLMKGSLKFLSGTWMNDIHGHLFKDAAGNILDAINHARDKVSSTYSALRKGDLDLVNRGYLLDKKYATEMGKYARLVDMSLRYNIHADRPAPALGKTNLWDEAKRYWQRNSNGDEVRRLYKELSPELQTRYTQEKQYAIDKQGQMADVILKKSLPLFKTPLDPKTGARMPLDDVISRAIKGNLTDEELEHYDDVGAGKVLREAHRLSGRKDVFFNGQRAGDKVVTGRYEMPKGGADTDHSGELLPDNQREFDTEQEAHKYVTSTHMPAVTREAHYWTDAATGKTKRVTADFATSDPGHETVKQLVSLERQHTMFAHTKAEALRNKELMERAGVKDVSGVLDKRDEKAWSQLNSADQNLMERKIAGRSNMTQDERESLRDITRQMMLASHTGMPSHFIESRKVAGGQFSTGDGFDAYSRAINFHIARESHSAELQQAMTRMDEHVRANQSDEDSDRRSMVANEMRNRVYGQAADALGSKSSPLVHRLMTYAFINFLVRPSHIFLSQIHPWVYSVPMMAARHGGWKAIQAQRQAMRDLGGRYSNLWEGAKAGGRVFQSLREKDTTKALALAHGNDPIQTMINRLTDPSERKAMQDMYETEHLHSAFDASMFAGKGIDYTNAIMRQFTDAMEANNRLSTALAAYRLEKACMATMLANALAYARRVIEQSHGVYSPTNIAPFMRNPIMRPMMQFHQQPMNLAMMMYRNISKALPEGYGGADTPEMRSEARWTLAYQLGTAAMLGGMGGMPLDLPKLASIASMGVGGPSPADWADKEQRLLVSLIGETGANIINEGLPGAMGPLGPSLGHRAGFDAGLVFGEPASGAPKDMIGWAAQQIMGASNTMVAMDWLGALQKLEAGDYQGAMEGALPGSLKDIAKAYRLGTQGQMAGRQQVYPGSVGDTILQLLGFSGVERERAMAGHAALKKALATESKGKSDIVNRFVQGGANQGDIAKWNAANPGSRITPQELQKARQPGKNVLGIKTTPQNRAMSQEYQHAYQ